MQKKAPGFGYRILARLTKLSNKVGGRLCVEMLNQQPPLHKGQNVWVVPPLNMSTRPFTVKDITALGDRKGGQGQVSPEGTTRDYMLTLSDPDKDRLQTNAYELKGHYLCAACDAADEEDNMSLSEELIGFELYDSELGYIGLVKDVISRPYQALAQVEYRDTEVLLPLAAELIDAIDEHQIIMRIPKGLLEQDTNDA